MATLKELRNSRLEKLKKIIELGIPPYPANSKRTVQNQEVHEKFNDLEGKTVTVVGRVRNIREHGNLKFIDLKDASGIIQLYIKSDNFSDKINHSNSELSFDNLSLLDIGDFIEAAGTVTKTKRCEVSVEPNIIRILTKSLRPLPDSWDGLKDKETRLRRRYLDTNTNKDVYDRFIRRSKFWQANREFLNKNGFIEMNIPVLESVTGGADAKPFVTHMDALNQDFYLRISQELYLKRLIGGGYEKVYEIGPRFRNEGLSDEHLPEHMAMEFYQAYADYNEGMDFVKEMFLYIVETVYQKTKFTIKGFDIDFATKWSKLDFSEVIQKNFNIDPMTTNLDEIKNSLEKAKIKYDNKKISIERGLDMLWKKIRKNIGGPVFLTNLPKLLSPLAKSTPNNPRIVERFHVILAGSEINNAFSELNDPQDQLQRFLEQEKLRESGDEEAQMLDIDYVEMLEYGMPPAFGYGHAERLFWYLEDVTAREGVIFPQLRHEIDEVTKSIYPNIFKPIN